MVNFFGGKFSPFCENYFRNGIFCSKLIHFLEILLEKMENLIKNCQKSNHQKSPLLLTIW
jgi:hypothetical protein